MEGPFKVCWEPGIFHHHLSPPPKLSLQLSLGIKGGLVPGLPQGYQNVWMLKSHSQPSIHIYSFISTDSANSRLNLRLWRDDSVSIS